MLRAKLHETRQCPSCGWIMKLEIDPDPRETRAIKADVSPVRFYLCANRACEREERAA